ncbi:MAG TPA: GWxTD domain-containing protein [Candidatus Saccharicenans sp.]|nr:GWxTD domain-containing protein [Candidatus Saccharicenans sp.]HRD01804.1 GWxTD domain-containing protein [Candidatus Saccharicenans sp.]
MKLIKESEDNNHQHDRLKRRLLFLLVLLLVVDLTGNGLALAGHRGELSGSNLAAGPQSSKKKEPAPKLPEKYKKWLEQEVIYIITPTEREIFLKLKSDRERDLFIEAFWKHRDPIPETEENEFKVEHYKRIEYANKYFGREAAKPGWMTDRGRIYIILGPPNDIQHIDGKSEIYNCEIWFYQGKQDMGLPPGFNLLFFQEKGTGERRLYSPTSDGPQALLTSFWGDPADYSTAYSTLREVDPTLANISLSLIPGEENLGLGRPSLSSDLLLRQIEQTPQKMVEDRYARKFFEYKDIIDVDYSVNYIDSDSLVKVLKDPSGLYFIHYDIEPSRLSVNQYDNQYATNFKVNGLLSTTDGRLVYQFEKTFPVKLTSAQFKERQHMPLAIYDVFPCVPGEYKLSILIKNEASKEFTSLEQVIKIPGKVQIEMSAPILAYRVSPSESAEGKIKAFLVGGQQLYLQASRVFTARDQLAVAVQIFGLTPELKEQASLRYQFFKESELFKEETYPVSELGTLPDLIKIFSLSDFSPAHYFLDVTLLIDGQEKITSKDEFDLTYLETLPRPWVLSRILPPATDPYYGWIIGNQLYNLGRLSEARTVLEAAMAKAPGNEDLAMELARVYVGLKDYQLAAGILDSFISSDQGVRYETYFVAAQALFNIGQYEKALTILDKAVAHHGSDVQLLDLIGDCYLKLGKKQEALAVWQKSLEINPDQPELRKKIQAVK